MSASSSESFLQAFSSVTGAGNFHSTGHVPFFFPGLKVDGLGEIAFPLPTAQARELAAVAEVAPYGQGDKTVRDEKVRKCWQLDASRFSIKSPQWKKFLKQTVDRIREDLGIKGKVSAVPYKLLIYGEGGHFKAHRDTEKLDAMFGSLIIALPSAHEGGRLLIRHDGREIEVDFSREDLRHEFQYAAFFADCEHEVEPVRSGFRCCLAYNLRLDDGDADALNLPLDTQARKLVAPLISLKDDCGSELTAVLLEHSYTEAGFSLKKLKGDDQVRAYALFAAAREAGFVAHLGLVTQYQMGELEDSGYRRRRPWDDEDEDIKGGVMGEIYDESLTIDLWRNENDRSAPLGSYYIEEDRLLSRVKFGTGDPDEKESEGYTGNAGCTMEYWYRRAAIVLWPTEAGEEILCEYNFQGACQSLVRLAARKGNKATPAFQRLAKAVIARLPGKLPAPGNTGYCGQAAEEPFALTLESLAKTKALDLLDGLLTTVPGYGWALCGAALWKKLHKSLGIAPFTSLYHRLIKGDPEELRRIIFPVLDALSAHKDGGMLARDMAAKLAKLKPGSLEITRWRNAASDPLGDPAEVRIMLAASRFFEKPKDSAAALGFVLGKRSLDTVRQVLAPVLLAKPALARGEGIGSEVLDFSKDLLKKETERPLPPFPDWKRPCPDLSADRSPQMGGYHRSQQAKQTVALRELADFMADPAAKSHDFRYPQDIRDALTNFISQHNLDLDHTTIRKGTPHTLSCTKNDKSHRRLLFRRAEDKELLEKLTTI